MENEVVYVVVSTYENRRQYFRETVCDVFRDKAKASAFVKKLYKEHLEDEENNLSKREKDGASCDENFACIESDDGNYRYHVWVNKREVQ